MAFASAAVHRNRIAGGGGFGGGDGGLPNHLPRIVPSHFNQSVSDDDPHGDSFEKRSKKKQPTQLIGDARIVNRAFSRLRIAEA